MATAAAAPNFPPGFLEQDRGWHVNATNIAFVVILVVSSIMRLCSRRLQKAGFMWSDLLMPLSLLFNLGQCVCIFLTVHYGAGKHVEAVPKEDLRPFTILSFYGIPMSYLGAVTFPKLAILDLYLNIFIDKFSRWTSWLMVAVLTLAAIVNYITVLTQCHPFSQGWHPVPGGHCNNISAHFTWAALPNIVTDLVMLLLPIPTIWRLQTTMRMKVGMSITFAVGSMGLATSVVRFYKFYEDTWFVATTNVDPTWYSYDTLVWAIVEGGVYHLCACCMTFRPLFRWIFFDSKLSSYFTRSLRGSSHGKSSGDATKDSNSSLHSAKPMASYRQDSLSDEWPAGTFSPREKGANKAYATTFQGMESGGESRPGIHVEHGVEVSQSYPSGAHIV